MGIQLECQYEEDLTKQPEARVRWYEAAGGTTLWEMTTDPVPPSMFAGYHYTVNPKKPGYDGLWGTHPEFGLMRGTENIIGTVVRSPRFEALRGLHFTETTRGHLTMTWVVSFSILRPFGPFPVNTMRRAGSSEEAVGLRHGGGLVGAWGLLL